MLKDLNELITRCRNTFDTIPSKSDIFINAELKAILQPALEQAESGSTFELSTYSIRLINNKGLRADIPSSWLWYGYAFRDLKEALNEYRVFVTSLKDYLKKTKGYSTDDINSVLKLCPSQGFLQNSSPIMEDLNGYILSNYNTQEQIYINKLLSDRDWWFKPLISSEQMNGKTLDRTDTYNSSLYLAARVIVANSDRLYTIAEAFVISQDLTRYFDSLDPSLLVPVHIDSTAVSLPTTNPKGGTNRIYYGAPGTGKSYKIKAEISQAKQIRTVFHPDTQYSDFVGSLKPKTATSSLGDPIITYEFRPGPFTKAFIEAEKLKSTSAPVYLVIEEINRAPAAAVFGELFQLLDRKADGSSEYEIELSDPDMLEYINSQLPTPVTSLSLPSNLFLMATMNSSDQAVKPMDTAFKRRWSFEYIQIDYSKATQGQLIVPLSSGTVSIKWATFAKIINLRLQNLGVPEDRLLGHRFLAEIELSTPEAAINSLCGKLFVYLWDDVLRHGRREEIFNIADYGTFGDLVRGYKDNCSVFCEELEEDFSSAVDLIAGVSEPEETAENE